MQQPAGKQEANGRRGASGQERTRGRGINATTSQQMRHNCSNSNGNGNGGCDGKCRAPPSWDLTTTALVLAAETAAALIADDANSGTSGVAIIGRASLGNKLILSFICC